MIDEIRGALAEGEPVLIFLAGPNGAGKSTFYRDYLRPLSLPFINADEIARHLRDSALPSESQDVEHLAFQVAEKLRSSLLEGGLSFCTETVFSDPQGAKLAFLQRARSLGYRTFLVFIGLSHRELSVARGRHWRRPQGRGRRFAGRRAAARQGATLKRFVHWPFW